MNFKKTRWKLKKAMETKRKIEENLKDGESEL